MISRDGLDWACQGEGRPGCATLRGATRHELTRPSIDWPNHCHRAFAWGLTNWSAKKPAMPWGAPSLMDPDRRGCIGSRPATEEVLRETAGRLDVSFSPVRTGHHSLCAASPQRVPQTRAARAGGPALQRRRPILQSSRLSLRLFSLRGVGDVFLTGTLATCGVRISLRSKAGKHTAQDCSQPLERLFVVFGAGARHEHMMERPQWKNPSRRERENFEDVA